MRYKPKSLPQISAPYTIVLNRLDDESINYDVVDVNPNDLDVSQGIALSDEVENVNFGNSNPIWISNDMKICDGHHRFLYALQNNLPINAVKINLNHQDSCRILNKIQDIYDYEEQRKLEEVVAQDVINQDNQIDSGVSDSEFLASIEENVLDNQDENQTKNTKTVIGYRKDPLMEDSIVGNFFLTNPTDGFSGYEIDFENLLDTNELGITYKESQQPIDILAKIWFPHVNFENLSEEHNTSSTNLKARAISERAKKYGYDGIKYGNNLIQGLK